MSIDFTRYLRSIFPSSTLASASASATAAHATSTGSGSSDAILVGSCSTVPARVVPLSDEPAGPRVVSSPVAGLVVGIAPADKVAVLTAFPHFKAAAYACLAHGSVDLPQIDLRPGESIDTPRRLAEHMVLPPCPIEQVLVVGSADPTFSPWGKDEVLALQWALHRLAVRAGRAVVHGAAPQRPMLLGIEPARLARWACDLRPMLQSAGIPYFEPQGRLIRPVVIEPKLPESGPGMEPDAPRDETMLALSRGYVTDLPPGLTQRPGSRHYTVSLRRAHARATVVGGLVVVHAGAVVEPVDRSCVQPCIAAKRRHMVEHGILEWTRDGLQRLTRDAAMPSLTNAARTMSGTNVAGDCWIEAA